MFMFIIAIIKFSFTCELILKEEEATEFAALSELFSQCCPLCCGRVWWLRLDVTCILRLEFELIMINVEFV